LGFSDVLLDPECPVANRLESVGTIRRNAAHLLTIIDDILDISKLESGRLTIDRAHVSPRDLALEITSLLHVRAEEKELKLSVEFHSAIPQTIDSDPKRLRQILLNLVGNAVKFTDAGEVRLSVKSLNDPARQDPFISFEVSDTGVGIAPEQLQGLFDCFNQGDMSAKRRFRGMGLGLAVSMRLARMLGGDIVVASTPGEGSIFRLVLPIRSAGESPRRLDAGGPAGGRAPAVQPALVQ
ncbi:MAG TPA: ATP-binding protein, partial [Planctomycetaceae bacterium]|nr:ATP-binding protein [Planctomycetaceae bacterium]